MKKSHLLVTRAFATVFCMSMVVPAEATLISDTVNCSITPTPTWICSTPSAVVGAGPEFELEYTLDPTNAGLDVDIGASSITISWNEDNTFMLGEDELLTLSDLDWVNEPNGIIVGITGFTSVLVTEMDASDVTFIDHSVTIDINDGAIWQPGSFVTFELVTTHVPEPTTLALLGLGLAGLGITRRKIKA